MERFIALTGFLVFFYFFQPINSCAQAYIQYSHLDSNSSAGLGLIKVVNGEAYVVQSDDQVGGNLKVKKYAVNGALLYSVNTTVSVWAGIKAMKVINGEVYLLGGKPQNVACCGMVIQAIKVSASGSIIFNRIISDTTSTTVFNPDSDVSPEITISGNEWIISASVVGLNFPTTMGGLIQNQRNWFLVKLNATTGEIIRSMAIPDGMNFGQIYGGPKIVIENGYLYTALTVEKPDLPVTIGNLPDQQGFSYHVYVLKLNLSDFSTVFSRYVSVNTSATSGDFMVKNGECHITEIVSGQTFFYKKLYADGSLAVSKSLQFPSALYISPDHVKITANHVYIAGSTGTSNGQYTVFAFKLNLDGSIVYLKNNPTTTYWWPDNKMPMEVIGDDLYMAGAGAAANYPITNYSNYIGPYTGYITHYGPSGNMVFSSFINPVSKMEMQNNKIYLVGHTEHPANPSTDSSQINGTYDCFLTVLKPDGTIVYNGYIGGSQFDGDFGFDVDDGSVYIEGTTNSPDFLTTEPSVLQNGQYGDNFLTKISFCPNRYNTAADTLSPAIQTVCKYGLAQIINGTDLNVPGDSLPITYANAVQTLQIPVRDIHYQWQKSLSISGPWTNILNATDRDYRPIIGTENEYFRRQSFLSSECGAAIIHTSDTATVITSLLTAPIVNFDDPIFTCPSSPIKLDATTAITGGQSPYNYSWDMGLPSIADPVVGPSVNTIYSLLVTDAAGCQQLGQVVVSVYKANAGADKSSCAGQSVRIGTTPLPSTSNISYDWIPVVGLDNSNIAQPMANPISVTDYALKVNLTKPDGTICITHDTVRVTPVAAPANPQFAGADKVICNHDSVLIGTLPETGFSYSWTPPTYITNPDTLQTYYYTNTRDYVMPVPNPATLYAYAKKDGCTFTDTLTVATIAANGGDTLCGAGIIGYFDLTPGIIELYSWTLFSGPGNFLGPTNMLQVPVSASVGGTSVYLLTASYNGTSCYGGTIVYEQCPPPPGCSILVTFSDSCMVNLQGFSSIPDGIYTWEPQVGLSAYTGNMVQLTDNIPRTYTVTVVSVHDSSLHTSCSIATVPAVYPSFSAPDTITCANEPVMIGAPTEPGNTYEWTGDGLSNYYISNPVATITHTSTFNVTVINSRGCKIEDTVLVTVPNYLADAGPNMMVCENAIVTLGTDSLPNTTYLWDPPASSWQNGTNQFSAQPQVLAATTVTYTLTTSTTGCSSSDEVNITVNNSPVIGNATDQISCAGSGVWMGLPPIQGATYQWSPVTGVNDPTSSNTYVSPATTTTYTLTAVFPGDCALPATDEVTITVRNLSFSMPDIQFCPQDGAIQLGANVPPGMNYYGWEPNNLVTNSSIATPQTINPPPGNITDLVLTVSDNSCYYSDTLQLIPFTEMPVVAANRTICKDQPIHIGSVANVTGATISYQWSPVNYLDDPTSPNPVFTGTNPGTYQYVLTKTDNSIPCSNSDTVILIVVDILPKLSSASICRNSCEQIGTVATSGITYAWTPQAGLSDPTSSNPIACLDSNSVSYILMANDGNGCVATDTITLSVLNVAGINASVTNVTACLGEPNVSLTPSVPTGSYSWLWSPDNNTLSNIYIPNPVIQTATPGTQHYTLEITDNGTGCTQTIPVTATINACPAFAGIGNFVWIDLNENGIQDITEPGASAVVVRLYNETGYLMTTSITDLNGNYNFGNVIPGNNYYIVFETPAGYEFTIQNVGGATATNNNKADASGRTGDFDLIAGNLINNMDAGIVPVGPVPVSLLSFKANLRNKEVILNWQTVNENNCQFFYVERSADAFAFNTIGRLNGHGTTSLTQYYHFTDHHPLDGFNYYRLRQTDFDGRFVYSQVEMVKLTGEDHVSVYYDSWSNSLHIHLNKIKNKLSFRLLAPNGQLIVYKNEKGGMTDYEFSLPSVSSGIYFLQMNVDGHLQTEKIYIVR